MKLTIVYLRDRMLLTKRASGDWRELQDEYRDFTTSLGPWDEAEVIAFLAAEYPADPVFTAARIRAFLASPDLVLAGPANGAGTPAARPASPTAGDAFSRRALLILLALALSATLFVGVARHAMAAHWGGGNFPPLVGHLAVILVGAALLAGNAGAAAALVISLVCGWRRWRSHAPVRERLAAGLFAGLALALLALQYWLWSRS